MVGTFDRVGAVALNAVLAADARIAETVVVFGQGVIGLLATQLLISQGSEVLAVDTAPRRLELARASAPSRSCAPRGISRWPSASSPVGPARTG